MIASDLPGKVLVLEAGSSGNSFLFNIPILQPLLQQSSYDWRFQTSPQENACKGLTNNRSNWPVGKIKGGSHRLNNMVYHRGHHSDYNEFISKREAEKLFDEVEENFPISRGGFRSFFGEAFIKAGQEIGFDDFQFTNLTHLRGRRFTQIDQWDKLEEPPEACLNALVTKILFAEEDPTKAVGVEFQKYGKLYKVFAKNIVLSAGAIGSPKVLLSSGIGPRKHLEEFEIDVRADLPVGENLQDHVTTGLDLIILNTTLGLGIKDLMSPFKILDFFWYGGEASPLAFAGSDAMGFVNLNQSSDVPDLSFMVLPVGLVADHGLHLRKIVNIREDIWENQFKRLIGQTTVSILPILLHPKSRGTVRLSSKLVTDSPEINPNYLSHVDDVKKLITGIRIIEKLIQTPSMQSLGAEINPKPFPGCEKFFFDSNDYWECYIRQMTLTMFHPVGTCKLGEQNDNSTVVLKNFQVKNTKNLFVVDGSILPKAPSANPHAIIAMLAKKFVKQILNNF